LWRLTRRQNNIDHRAHQAVEKAGTTDLDAVIDAIIGVSVPNLSGGYSTKMPNHHITKPVLIGEIQADGRDGVADLRPRCPPRSGAARRSASSWHPAST